jgi:hypothetical protein
MLPHVTKKLLQLRRSTLEPSRASDGAGGPALTRKQIIPLLIPYLYIEK